MDTITKEFITAFGQFVIWDEARGRSNRKWFIEPDFKVYVRVGDQVVTEGTFTAVTIANYEGSEERLLEFIASLRDYSYQITYMENPGRELFEELLVSNFQIDRFQCVSQGIYRNFYRFNKAGRGL